MTSKAVAQVGFYPQNVTNANRTGNTPKGMQNSFSDVMNQNVRQSETEAARKEEPQKTAPIKKQNAQQDAKQAVKTESKPEKAEKPVDGKVDSNDKVAEQVKEITEAIKKELGVSEEDIAKAMEMLNMQAIDLFLPNELSNLIAELSGENGMLAIVTNEDLYASFSDILKVVEGALNEISKELELSPEEFKQMLENLKTEMNQSVAGQTENVEQSKIVEAFSEDGAENRNVPKEEASIGYGKEADAKTVNTEEIVTVSDENAKGNTENDSKEGEPDLMQGNAKNGEQTEKNLLKTTGMETSAKTEETSTEQPKAVPNMMQTFAEQMTAKLDAVLQKAVGASEMVDTQRIMKQVTDYLKIQVRPEVTEMEMRLNPANLGSINLSVAYKDGALTAQFTAQNEAVKTALESQIVQLRENLNEQGVKVEAIEVTIASHQFERNLSQGNAQDGDNANASKQGKRKINLEAMDGLEEELDDAERIAVSLMKENGNTVDFTA